MAACHPSVHYIPLSSPSLPPSVFAPLGYFQPDHCSAASSSRERPQPRSLPPSLPPLPLSFLSSPRSIHKSIQQQQDPENQRENTHRHPLFLAVPLRLRRFYFFAPTPPSRFLMPHIQYDLSSRGHTQVLTSPRLSRPLLSSPQGGISLTSSGSERKCRGGSRESEQRRQSDGEGFFAYIGVTGSQ